MLSLGIGLEAADFRRVISRRYPFAIGAVCQVVLLPVVALVMVKIFALRPAIAVGFMLLSFCPGGVTSNILSKLAKADVALSVSLTAVISLLSKGLGLARVAKLSWNEAKTISIETGIQNSTLGITLAALITGTESGFSPLALPSAVYGITMYAVAIPFIAWYRNR